MKNIILNEDCLLTMRKMPDNYLDCVVTDPPYGYSFMGKDWDKVVPSVEIWSECLRVLKAGAFAFIMSAPRQDVLSHMIANLDKAGFDTSFTSIYWTYASGFPKAMNMGKSVQKKQGIELEDTGIISPISRPNTKKDLYKSGKVGKEFTIKNVTTEEAKKLDGSFGGFQPKPAVEIIIVVMKPLDKPSYTEQALDSGKGVTWLDDCRVPFSGKADIDSSKNNWKPDSDYTASNTNYELGIDKTNTVQNDEGRFPANLLVSDDVLNDGKVYQGQQGEVTGEEDSKFERGNTHGDYSGVGSPMKPRNDAGSFSRYYDVDRWWDERINSLPENVRKVFPFLITPKAAKSEKNFGCEGMDKKNESHIASKSGGGGGWEKDLDKNPNLPRANHHPTVKPIKLMSYLITLGSRDGDIIYDPFSGSGTTLIAARMTARNFIGSEINKEYFEIAEKRLLPYVSQQSIEF